MHPWWGPLRSWYWPWCSPSIPLRKHCGALVFYKSTIQFRLYQDPPSRIKPPGISTILWRCTTSDELLLVRYFSSILPIHRFWVVVNLEHLIPFTCHPFSPCRRYSMASSKTSQHDVSWSSSPLEFSKCVLNSWWKIPSLSDNDLCYHRQPPFDSLHAYTNLVMYVLICCPLERYTPDTCVSSPFPFHWSV